MRTKPKIEIDLSEVERLAGLGLNKAQIADAMGFSYETIRNRQKESTDFADALKRGKAQRVGHVANKLQELIDEGNLGAIIFYLKTQGGYVETQKQIVESTEAKKPVSGMAAIYQTFQVAGQKK